MTLRLSNNMLTIIVIIIFGINSPKGFKKITLRNAKQLEWSSVVQLCKAGVW